MHKRNFLAFVALVISSAAVAHHSTAAYDLQHDVVVEGVIEEYRFTNPHTTMKVQGHDAGGAPVSWSIESSTPTLAVRMGWSPATFKPGDKATFVIHPRLDGEKSGVLAVAILADGTRLSGMTQPVGPLPGAAK